jgi:hypothetical protein
VQGHANNIHCLALAVNQLLGCLFSLGGHDDIEDRLKVRATSQLSYFKISHENPNSHPFGRSDSIRS